MSSSQNLLVGAHVVPSTSTNGIARDHPRMSLEPSKYTPSPSQVPTPTEEYDPTSTHPFSAFYSHPTTRTSFEQHKSESKTNINVYEKDLELGSPSPRIRQSLDPARSVHSCTVWPARRQLLEKHIAMKKSEGCSPMRNLSKKQRLWVKILIALLIVGGAIAIGVGVSKAVGAGVWKSINNQAQIGS